MAAPVIVVQLWVDGRVKTASVSQFPEDTEDLAAQAYKQAVEVVQGSRDEAKEQAS